MLFVSSSRPAKVSHPEPSAALEDCAQVLSAPDIAMRADVFPRDLENLKEGRIGFYQSFAHSNSAGIRETHGARVNLGGLSAIVDLQ